jgi:hypothetical protein
MKKILIWAVQPQRFLDQVRFADKLDEIGNGKIQIVFFIANNVFQSYPDLISELKYRILNDTLLEKKNNSKAYKYIKLTSFIYLVINVLRSIKRKKIWALVKKLKNIRLYDNFWERQEIKQLKMLQHKFDEINPLFDENEIDLVFIEGDRHITLGYEPAILRICKERGIPSVIPYLVYPSEEENLAWSSNNKHIKEKCYVSRYVIESQKRFKSIQSNGKYFYPHSLSNALYKFGTLTDNPWYMGSGKSTILCLPNQVMVEKYISKGISEKKIRLLGDISYDTLYEQYIERDCFKKGIFENYGLDYSKKCVLIALPQLAEHNILSWDVHWKEIDFLLETLKCLNISILVSLHPKMDRKKYSFIENKYDCHILDERLAEVLPVADLFVATFSSTVLWAVLCGIRTVVVDFYNLNYSMYDSLETVNIVNQKSMLRKALIHNLSEDTDFTSDWTKLSKDEVFDGKTIEKYLNLIEEITETKNETHK